MSFPFSILAPPLCLFLYRITVLGDTLTSQTIFSLRKSRYHQHNKVMSTACCFKHLLLTISRSHNISILVATQVATNRNGNQSKPTFLYSKVDSKDTESLNNFINIVKSSHLSGRQTNLWKIMFQSVGTLVCYIFIVINVMYYIFK